MENEKRQVEEEILRRVFSLCYLNAVCYANYRQLVNPDRFDDTKSALNYTIPDHNYVTIRRTQLLTVYQAIVDQPGPTFSLADIEKVLQRWSNTQSDVSLQGYRLDKDTQRLVRQPNTLEQSLPLVLFEKCPRKGIHCVSFLVSFLKQRIPDLMGDRQFEDLGSVVPSISVNDPMSCITCDNGRRELTMMISCHYKTCSECNKNETLSIECPMCHHKETECL